MHEKIICLVEYAYNNGYQSSLEMSPYQALYGRECQTLVSWDDLMDQVTLGPDMVKEMEHKVIKIRKKLNFLGSEEELCRPKVVA